MFLEDLEGLKGLKGLVTNTCVRGLYNRIPALHFFLSSPLKTCASNMIILTLLFKGIFLG